MIRMRSFVRLISGRSSALKTVGAATPSSRAASTFDLPAAWRNFFANAASSFSSVGLFIFTAEENHKQVTLTIFFLAMFRSLLI
jgi:hypothetical protein